MSDPRPSTATPQEALAQARRAVEAERPGEALPILRDLLAHAPGEVMARFELARALSLSGDAEGARAAFEMLLAAAPKEPAIWVEFALAEWRVGAGPAFRRRIRAASLPAPVAAMADGAAQGTGARAQGAGAATRRDLAAMTSDPHEAERVAARLGRGGAPMGALVLALLGQARLVRGARAEAVAAFRAGLAQEPLAVDLRLGLARALAGEPGLVALAEARRAARAAPAWAEAQLTFGRLCLRHGLKARAMEAAEAALAAAPRADAALALAAEAALATGAPDRATTFAERRRKGVRDRSLLLARAATDGRRSEAALGHFADALSEGSDPAEVRLARAALLQSLGRMDEAEADLRTILADRPRHGAAARALAYGRRLDPDGPEAAAMRAALDAPETPQGDRRLLRFALARITERSDPAESFAHLARAKADSAVSHPHDAAADRADLARLTGPDWVRLRDAGVGGTAGAAPIFVTGLPRSGTTLVEAILAAHPEVRAGGELGLLTPAMAPLDRALAAGEAPDAALLDRVARDYLAAAEGAMGGPDKRRHTDKSIHSFVRIGQIRAVLPQARIVVVHRDPRDTALSLWRNQFADGQHRYANTPEGIAEHVALFRDAVAAWHAALPGGFHEIAYETLLDDPEGEARRMLDACGLDWDPGVLSFHERAERVDTLSFAQVRQPLYRSSKGGWRSVETHMRPLLDALERKGVLPGA